MIRNSLLIIWNNLFHATRWIEFLLSLYLILFLFIRHVVWKNHEVFVFDDCWRIWNRVRCSFRILFHMMITIDKTRVSFFFKFQLWKRCDAKYAKHSRLIRAFLIMTQTKRQMFAVRLQNRQIFDSYFQTNSSFSFLKSVWNLNKTNKFDRFRF